MVEGIAVRRVGPQLLGVVAEAAGELVGAAWLERTAREDQGRLHIFVDARWQRKGIGSHLLLDVIGAAAAMGLSTVVVDHPESDLAANALIAGTRLCVARRVAGGRVRALMLVPGDLARERRRELEARVVA